MGAHQLPLPPAAGFLAPVETSRYPVFPDTPLRRIGWALNASMASASAKSVLVILAYHADANGRAWPSVETIAREASLSRRAAVEAIRRLQRAGWLTVIDRRPLTSVYRPKAPADQHCCQCWSALPSEATLCPVCGWEPNMQELHPKN